MAKSENNPILFEEEELYPSISKEKSEKGEFQIIELQKVVDYEIREYTIELLVLKYKEGQPDDTNEIFIPKYQRRFVWNEKQQSKFIESLLLGLPIPYMFLADKEGRSEIVDGSQRIRTLESFLDNKLQLIDLQKLTDLEDFRFKDLPKSRQLRFKKKTIRLIELTDKADLSVRKDIFERINTTPVVLSAMEIRRGAYEGDFLNFVGECAKDARLHNLCPISEKRGEREEYNEIVLRFFAYGEKYLSFEHDVAKFLNDYVKEKNETGFDAEKMMSDFEDMLDFVEKHFPYGFKKTINHKSTPRVRFEAISVGVYLALKENSNLKPQIPVIEWLVNNPYDFNKHTTSDAANNKLKFLGRIEFVKKKLLGIE